MTDRCLLVSPRPAVAPGSGRYAWAARLPLAEFLRFRTDHLTGRESRIYTLPCIAAYKAGYRSVGQVQQASDAELIRVRGIGLDSLGYLRELVGQ